MPPRTLFEKVWDAHVVAAPEGQSVLLYVDLHLVHEVTSPQAFDGLRAAGRAVRQPLRTVATVDHNIPTTPRGLPIADPIAAKQIEALQKNCREFGVPLFDMDSSEQGIVHVIQRVGDHVAGDDDRLRRQPHFDAWRVWLAGVWHWHLGGGACAGHAMFAADETEDDADQCQRKTG